MSSAAAPNKLFILDTNVLMHDPTSLFRFEEHDLFIPMVTLEELDDHKKGLSEVARNARQASRLLDEMICAHSDDINLGIPLGQASHGLATGRLFLQTEALSSSLPASLPTSRADNQILAVTLCLTQKYSTRPVILVSKDINMRIKARALGLTTQDYFNDKTLEDTDLLYSGTQALPDDFWDTHGQNMKSWNEAGRSGYEMTGPLCAHWLINQMVWLETTQSKAFSAQVRHREGQTVQLRTLIDYAHTKNAVWGITARNREQNFALNILLDPDIDFVSLIGQAGTGKTLLALAAGLTQTLELKRYSEIIITRVTVPVGEDIGFLPGTEEEKMTPWMGAIEDNLDVLNHPIDPHNKSEPSRSLAHGGNVAHAGANPFGSDWGRQATMDLIRSRIKIKSLNFMRGRTFVNKFVIIDESQNLTPKQMKTLITRAGPGTKVVCLGNIAQIDTPYLTEGSSGLTYVVDRLKDWPHAGHVTLQRGERSRLADHASDVL
jgi:PhoH-like ATPase